MKKCSTCGQLVDDVALFCPQDGEASWDKVDALIADVAPIEATFTSREVDPVAEPLVADVDSPVDEPSAPEPQTAPPAQRHEPHHNRRRGGHR